MRHSLDPEPGQSIRLLDDTETRVRQTLASDDHLGIYEVRDDRGQIIFITLAEAPGLWIELQM